MGSHPRRLVPALAILAILAGASAATAAPASDYEILYTERTAEFSGDGTLREGDAKAFRFVVSQPNVTRIDFVLTWSETHDRVRVSTPDRFSLSVFDADGGALPVERANDGEVHVRAQDVNRVPQGGPARADELEARLSEGTSTEGVGEWRALVKLEDVGNPDGARVDEGNDFHLVVVMHFYEGVPMRVVSLSKPQGLVPTEERTWGWAAGALAAVALLLAVTLVLQQRRRRALSRAAVTDALGVSPGGDTSSPSKR